MINNFWNGLLNGFNFGMHFSTPMPSCSCNNFSNFLVPDFSCMSFIPTFSNPIMSDASVFSSFPATNPFNSFNTNFSLFNFNVSSISPPQQNFNFGTFPSYSMPTWGGFFNAGFDTFNGSFGAGWPSFGSLTGSSYSGSVNNYAPCSSVSAEAARYLGKYDAASAKRKFSKSGNHAGGWCADFATYCAKQVLPKYPQSMVTASPDLLRQQAKKYNCYQTAPSSGKSEWAKNNIKPGDLVITGGNGQSGLHVIVVKEVKVKNGQTVISAYSGNDGGGVVQTEWPVEKGRWSKKKGGWYMPVYGVVNVGKFA